MSTGTKVAIAAAAGAAVLGAAAVGLSRTPKGKEVARKVAGKATDAASSVREAGKGAVRSVRGAMGAQPEVKPQPKVKPAPRTPLGGPGTGLGLGGGSLGGSSGGMSMLGADRGGRAGMGRGSLGEVRQDKALDAKTHRVDIARGATRGRSGHR